MRCSLPVAPLGISARNRIFLGVLKAAMRSRQEGAQLVLGRARALAQHHGRGDILAELLVRHGEGDDLQHRGMIHQHLVDLARRDFLAAAVDDLLQPAGEA